MIGRQLCVVSCMFFIARHFSECRCRCWRRDSLGRLRRLAKFFNTGLLGAIITTIVASIAWQLVASAFLSPSCQPFTYFLRICLFLEATGLCSGAWVLAWVNKTVSGYQRDEVYIGTAETCF
jgi:hypothetical protein